MWSASEGGLRARSQIVATVGHRHERQDDRRQDRPSDLQPRVAVELRRHPIAALAVPVTDGHEDDPALDDHEDQDRDPEHGDEEVLDLLRVRTGWLERVLLRRSARRTPASGRRPRGPGPRAAASASLPCLPGTGAPTPVRAPGRAHCTTPLPPPEQMTRLSEPLVRVQADDPEVHRVIRDQAARRTRPTR